QGQRGTADGAARTPDAKERRRDSRLRSLVLPPPCRSPCSARPAQGRETGRGGPRRRSTNRSTTTGRISGTVHAGPGHPATSSALLGHVGLIATVRRRRSSAQDGKCRLSRHSPAPAISSPSPISASTTVVLVPVKARALAAVGTAAGATGGTAPGGTAAGVGVTAANFTTPGTET